MTYQFARLNNMLQPLLLVLHSVEKGHTITPDELKDATLAIEMAKQLALELGGAEISAQANERVAKEWASAFQDVKGNLTQVSQALRDLRALHTEHDERLRKYEKHVGRYIYANHATDVWYCGACSDRVLTNDNSSDFKAYEPYQLTWKTPLACWDCHVQLPIYVQNP